MIRQGSQRAVCMWDKYNMDIVQYAVFHFKTTTDLSLFSDNCPAVDKSFPLYFKRNVTLIMKGETVTSTY